MEYVYKGFSTKQFMKDKNFVLTDIDLVKEDLINHIFTRRGERVKMPTFGTSIPDLAFEPITDELLIRMREELEYVFNYDPRVALVDLIVIPLIDENTVMALVDLDYVELGEKDRMSLRIEMQA